MDLIEFLRARLSEDEAAARATKHADGPRTLAWRPGGARHLRFDNQCSENYSAVFTGEWDRILIARDDTLGGPLAAHIARWDPVRVLAEVEAKRRTIDVLELAGNSAFPADAWALAREALRELAQPYRDHPDFDPSWLASETFRQRWVMGTP